MSAQRARYAAAAFTILVLVAAVLAAHSLLWSGASTVPPPTLREQHMLADVNDERVARGLAPLRYDPTLARVARDQTRRMIVGGYFAHDAPGGPSYRMRVLPVLRQPGRHELAENIALGSGPYGSSAQIVSAWMHSSGHRANILNPTFRRTGFGVTVAPSFQGDRQVTVATDEFSN